MQAILKVMSSFTVKVHAQKQIPYLVTGDVPLLLHEIPRNIQPFLPLLHELEYAAFVEICFIILQPCMHSLQDCLIIS
jgi:hypothetical protein